MSCWIAVGCWIDHLTNFVCVRHTRHTFDSDINVLLIGDPSVAKSQLLRYVLNTAPRAIPTTGRGSSGVGLTAAVTTDQETGERRLEAGAMVLADRGVVCIDEFDKMSDIDRTAIHEVMEQGKVTIAKAGIHASLNARCSVLAAANPVYGRYDQYKSPMENIGLQDSLLSRFDLLFVMLDVVDSDLDAVISDFVVRMHRYRNPKEQDGDVLPMGSNFADMLSTFRSDQGADGEPAKETPMYEKYDLLLHGASRSRTEQILSMEFMRKYIHLAKILKPKLTEQACDVISTEYSRLRSLDEMEQDHARTQPVTARTLETLIRLSTAHAKARMSKSVTVTDAKAAIGLVQYATFKKVLEKEKRKRRRSGDTDNENDDDETENADHVDEISPERNATNGSRSKRTRLDASQANSGEADDVDDFEQPIDAGDLTRRPTRRSLVATPSTEMGDSEEMSVAATISDERLREFQHRVQAVFRQVREQSLSLVKLMAAVNEGVNEPFDAAEARAAIARMTDANKIMLADDIVFLI